MRSAGARAEPLARRRPGARARLDALSDVISVRFDRSFPHTLHVIVKPEHAVLLVRQGKLAGSSRPAGA